MYPEPQYPEAEYPKPEQNTKRVVKAKKKRASIISLDGDSSVSSTKHKTRRSRSVIPKQTSSQTSADAEANSQKEDIAPDTSKLTHSLSVPAQLHAAESAQLPSITDDTVPALSEDSNTTKLQFKIGAVSEK